MLKRDNSVVFLGAWIDACALWRLYMPFLNLPGSGFYVFKSRPKFDLFAGVDVVVVQRCCTQPQYEFLKIARMLGLKIVYDLDDDVWNLPDYNPAAQALLQFKAGFAACIQMVDAVTVSTKTLAKVVKKNVGRMVNLYTNSEIPIFVCENRLDERMFVAPHRSNNVIVGWAGSSSHIGDLALVEDAVVAASTEFPETQFEFRGCVLASDSKLLGVPSFTHKPWMPVPEFGARMPLWGWSVALAPVTNHDFNSSKSGIKMLEAAYCKIPCLASWVRPYEEICFRDSELKWLLCAGPSAFTTKLRVLLNEPARREELGQRLYNVMHEHYSFKGAHESWQEVFSWLGAPAPVEPELVSTEQLGIPKRELARLANNVVGGSRAALYNNVTQLSQARAGALRLAKELPE